MQMMQVTRGGILMPRAREGDVLVGGQPLADLVDPYGDVVEMVTCPFPQGFVASMRRRGFIVHPGDRVSIVLEVQR